LLENPYDMIAATKTGKEVVQCLKFLF